MKPAELKSIRRRLAYTQRKMAKELGVSLSLYVRLENGQARIRKLHLNAIRWVVYAAERR